MPGLVYIGLLVCDLGLSICDLRIGWRAMMRQVCATFIASLSVAFILTSNQAFGQRAAHDGGSASRHSSVTAERCITTTDEISGLSFRQSKASSGGHLANPT